MINAVKRLYKKMSIRQKFLLLFSVQIIIPMTFMGIFLYNNTYHIIQNKSVTYCSDLLHMTKLRINDFCRDMNNVSQSISYDSNVYKILRANKFETAIDENMTNEMFLNLRKTCLANKESIQAIAIVAENDKVYPYDINAGSTGLERLLPLTSMREAAENKEGLVWYYELKSDGSISDVYALHNIKDADDLERIGLMVILINRDNLKKIYSDLSTEFVQNINLLTNDNKWIIGTERAGQLNGSQEVLFEEGCGWDYEINQKEKYLVAGIEIEQLGWKIIATCTMKNILNEDLSRFRRLFIVMMICMICMLSIFSILMALDIVKPIKRLVHSMKGFEKDNIHEVVIVDREDELGYLSHCFNKMTMEIDRLLNQVYKERLTRKEAELKALQAQINPHFLFNTLESINWMAQLNNVPEIRDMVTSLGALMEASIGKGSSLIPLKRELHYIESYLLIMKNRYGERLMYESEVDESVLNTRVPKLILQPLIENAIYHGIDKCRKKGSIKLKIYREGQLIYIEIIDTGKGMLKEKVEALNEAFEKASDDYLLGETTSGIGLKNVNGRLKLFFGAEYGLSVESEYECYTKMKLKMPFKD